VIAIDTNVLVRLLVNDDEAQGSRARAVFEREEVWIGKTVLLETFWVLRSVYDFKDIAIAHAIEAALGLARVRVEDSERVEIALAAVYGIDIADAPSCCYNTWRCSGLRNLR
jgi:predicted nucleic-acid-binding protein